MSLLQYKWWRQVSYYWFFFLHMWNHVTLQEFWSHVIYQLFRYTCALLMKFPVLTCLKIFVSNTLFTSSLKILMKFSNILISKKQFLCNKKSYCTLVQNQWIKLLSPSQLVTSIQYTKKLNIFKKFQNFKIFKNFIILKISKISKISRILCYFNLCYTHSCYYCFWCIRTSENNDLINIWALLNLHRVLL